MSYVALKHLLADLAIEAVRSPADAGWPAVTAAYAELAMAARPMVPWSDALTRAAAIGAPRRWTPTDADIRHLIDRGLFSLHETTLIALPDRFLPHFAYFRRHAPRVLNAITELRRPTVAHEISDDVRIGAALFNAGLFFECHEWCEGLWKAAGGEEKEFFHGIVQAAAAFYHHEKGNAHGSRTLLRKGRQRLTAYPAQYLGVDLARFGEDLSQWAAHFDGAPRPEVHPRIAFSLGGTHEKVKGAPRG